MISRTDKVDILKDGRFIFPLSIIIELIYFSLSLTTAPPLLMAIIVFPSLLVLPGMMVLAVLRRSVDNMVKLVVEGFFVSTVMLGVLASFMFMLGFPLIPFTYSLAALIFVVFLIMIGLVRKMEFKPSKYDNLLAALAFSSYVVLLLYFSRLPRLFTPDETSYIFSARMGILNGAMPPMGVRPNTSEIGALLQGRYFWIYLLTSFIGSTGLPAYQAGLLGVGFLIMTALTSSLIVKNKWVRMAVFATVVINPLLFSFSALTLNDLAISFYIVFAVLFFVKSFSKIDNNISINITNLFYSLIGLIALTLIKPNLLAFAGMWIILVYIMLRYKLHKQNRKYKFLLIAVLSPILIYELCVDIPYVISVWILRSRELADLFGKFLFISPAERFVGMFMAPWWNSAAPTLFNRGFADYLDYFYRLLMPEASSILISAIILVLPIFILSRKMRKELDKTVLTSLVLMSLCLFYLDGVSSAILSDISRYSLCIIPLWIPIALLVLQDIKNRSSLRKLFPVFIGALAILLVNIWLSREKGGVFVGYGLPSRLWTADAIMVQLLALTVVLGLLFLRADLTKVKLAIGKKLSFVKTVDLKNTIFSMIIILILLNGIYFSSQFMDKSTLYEDHGFDEINTSLNDLAGDENLVFANNYISLRPYISDELFIQGLLLPPPDTKEDLLKLLEILPNNTLFLISDDDAATWYEYANNYIKGYTYSDTITPEKSDVSKFPNLNLTDPFLKMTFDGVNETTVLDYSGFGNDGTNYGARPVEGYYGIALKFEGEEYVSIPANVLPKVQDGLTISFFSLIQEGSPDKLYIPLSKGDTNTDGSYHISIWDGKISFTLRVRTENGVEKAVLSLPVQDYLNSFHSFVFTYDCNAMDLYVDGRLVASNSAKGSIVESSLDLEIGRSSLQKSAYFVGLIDELQISNKPSSYIDLVEIYFQHYALKVNELPLLTGEASLFRINNMNHYEEEEVSVTKIDTYLAPNENKSVCVDISVHAQNSTQIYVAIGTSRYLKLYEIQLTSGHNGFAIPFNYVSPDGGLYWPALGSSHVLIFDNATNIIYNGFLSVWNLNQMNVLLGLLSFIILVLYLCVNFIVRYV